VFIPIYYKEKFVIIDIWIDKKCFNALLLIEGITEARIYLATSLGRICQERPGKYPALISQSLAPEEAAHLKRYLDGANIRLV
jgi:hypothetical protein